MRPDGGVIAMTGRTLISGLVMLFVVVLVPAGLAAERPDDRSGPIGVGSVAGAAASEFTAYGTADTVVARMSAGLDAYGNPIAAVTPDNRADRFTPGSTASAPTLPDDRAERFTPGSATQPVTATPTADSGIDWGDPMLVGGLAVLVVGLATAAAVAVVHRHRGGPGTRGTPGMPTPTH
jgi:hypothetical protein